MGVHGGRAPETRDGMAVHGSLRRDEAERRLVVGPGGAGVPAGGSGGRDGLRFPALRGRISATVRAGDDTLS